MTLVACDAERASLLIRNVDLSCVLDRYKKEVFPVYQTTESDKGILILFLSTSVTINLASILVKGTHRVSLY